MSTRDMAEMVEAKKTECGDEVIDLANPDIALDASEEDDEVKPAKRRKPRYCRPRQPHRSRHARF